MQTSLDSFLLKPRNTNIESVRSANQKPAFEPRPLTQKRAREVDIPASKDGTTQKPLVHRTERPTLLPLFLTSTITTDTQRKLSAVGATSGVSSLAIEKDQQRFFTHANPERLALQFSSARLGAVQQLLSEATDATGNIRGGGKFPWCVLDFSLDSQNELSVVRQKTSLTLIPTPSCSGNTVSQELGSDPILRLSIHRLEQRESNRSELTLGYSAAEFLGSSLNVMCGISRGHTVEVFDMEDVDETVCESAHSFDLRKMKRFGRCSTAANDLSQAHTVHVTDILPINEQVALCALTTGESAWCDLRQEHAIQSTQSGTASRTYGALNITDRSVRGGPSPLTSLSFTDNMHHFATGAKDGWIKLWDSRYTQMPIDSFQNNCEICSIRPWCNERYPGSVSLWVNDYAGNVFGLSCGSDGLTEIRRIGLEDAFRTEDTASLPPRKITISQTMGMLFYPHLSSNSLIGLPLPTHVSFNQRSCADFDVEGIEHFDSREDVEEDSPLHQGIFPSMTGFQTAADIFTNRNRAAVKPPTQYASSPSGMNREFMPTVRVPLATEQETFLACCCACESEGSVLVGSASGGIGVVSQRFEDVGDEYETSL